MIVQSEERLKTPAEATLAVEDGMTVAIGGFNTGAKPHALVRELIRQGRKDLTIATPSPGLEVDLLIGCGCVSRLITPHAGFEDITGAGPLFRRAVEQAEIEVFETDAGLLLIALKATRQGVPFLPWRGGGASLPDLNPNLKMVADPFTNELVIAVRALAPDIALLHASQADACGNVQHLGHSYWDVFMAEASKHTIVSVERIVGPDAQRDHTTISERLVNTVVHAPYGAHPGFSQGHYVIDREHIREYLAAGEARLRGDGGAFDRYVERYIHNAPMLVDYLEAVGAQRLLGLEE